jgi:hypothetical protein
MLAAPIRAAVLVLVEAAVLTLPGKPEAAQ